MGTFDTRTLGQPVPDHGDVGGKNGWRCGHGGGGDAHARKEREPRQQTDSLVPPAKHVTNLSTFL